jgi:L-gulonate 3-dehydrogenase
MVASHFDAPTVTIVGGGSIGIAFAFVFARRGWTTRIHDPDPGRLALVRDEIVQRLYAL